MNRIKLHLEYIYNSNILLPEQDSIWVQNRKDINNGRAENINFIQA